MRKRRFNIRDIVGWFTFAALLSVSQSLNADLDRSAATWRFDVFLDERAIGFHEFRVATDDSQQNVRIEAAFDFKHWLLPDYEYRHNNEETWDSGCLTRIDATTQTNGRAQAVNQSLGTDEAALSRKNCVMSFAYWNPALVESAELLDPQTGELRPVRIEPKGEEFVPFSGKHLRANRYDLYLGKQIIRVWYEAETNRWVRLEAPARGKRILRYEPTELPSIDEARLLVTLADT